MAIEKAFTCFNLTEGAVSSVTRSLLYEMYNNSMGVGQMYFLLSHHTFYNTQIHLNHLGFHEFTIAKRSLLDFKSNPYSNPYFNSLPLEL